MAADGCGPVGGLLNLFRIAAQWIDRGKFVEKHPVIARDHGQQVVEVVRHPAGQQCEGLHFLRLHPLFFDLFARGDVADKGDGEQAFSGFEVTETDFHGELGSVKAAADQVFADTRQADVRASKISVKMASVGRP